MTLRIQDFPAPGGPELQACHRLCQCPSRTLSADGPSRRPFPTASHNEIECRAARGTGTASGTLSTAIRHCRPTEGNGGAGAGERDEHDVFLAYNATDKQAVLSIAKQLRQRNIGAWIEVEQIPTGRSFQDVIQAAILNVKSAAVFLGPRGVRKWQAVELRSLVGQCVERGIPVIPVLLPGVDALPDEFLFLREFRWVKFQERLDEKDALDQLEWGIRGA